MTFQRENRYIVVKLKDLAPGQEADIREHLTELSAQPVDSLVIERDWPEYEPAWRMIQARVEGATLSPAHIEDEREAFEASYCAELEMRGGRIDRAVFTRDAVGDYIVPGVQSAWWTWQARAAFSAPHEQAELWAVHVEGPDDLYAAFSREDAERHASELNAIPTPDGISISAVVIPSPWGAVEHWQYLAEQEREHVESMRAALSAPPAADGSEPAEVLAARLISERSAVLGHPVPWAQAIEITATITKMADEEKAALLALDDAPPAAGVPIGMACKINGYWEAQLFAGHGCIDRQSLYAHPLPPADVPTGLAHRLLKAYDHGDTGAIEAAIEDIRTMLAAAPTPPASEQQDEPEYGPTPGCKQCEEALGCGLSSCPECDAEFYAPASEQRRAVVMPEGLREVMGKAASSWLYENDPQGLDWCDPRNVDALLDALFEAAPHLAKGEGV